MRQREAAGDVAGVAEAVGERDGQAHGQGRQPRAPSRRHPGEHGAQREQDAEAAQREQAGYNADYTQFMQGGPGNKGAHKGLLAFNNEYTND